MKEIYFTKPLNNLQNYSLTNPPLKTVPDFGEPLKGGYAFLCYAVLYYSMLCVLCVTFLVVCVTFYPFCVTFLRVCVTFLLFMLHHQTVCITPKTLIIHHHGIYSTQVRSLFHTCVPFAPVKCPPCSTQVSRSSHTCVHQTHISYLFQAAKKLFVPTNGEKK